MSGQSLVERIVRAEGLAYESAQTGEQIEALGALFAPILADVRELERALRAHEFDCRGYCITCDGFDVGQTGSTRRAHRKDCTTLAILTKCAKEST